MNRRALALASWLCALWGRHEGARGGRLLPVCGASRGWALSEARPPVLGACGQGPLPTGCGCGGGGRGDPSPTPQRALLRAGFARCGGGTSAPWGGASCRRVGLPGLGALPRPTARPQGVWHGPATYWLWVRCAGVGARPSLLPSPVPRFVVCSARFLASRHPVAVVAWHLSSCRGFGQGLAYLACLVAPRWCAAPRPVRSLSVLRSVFLSPWCLLPPQRLSLPALLGGWAGHMEAGQEPGSLCLPLAPAEARALGALRVVPVRGPTIGCPWRVPPASVFGCVCCGGLACVDPVTNPSGFPYGLSFNGGLSRCTGAVSCGRRHLLFRVRGRHAWVLCVCVCVLFPGRVLVPLTFLVAVLSFFLVQPPAGLERYWCLVCRYPIIGVY